MSQQPPYGSGEPNQPPPPYTPYSPGAYPNPYQAYPQRRDHTTRNVLLAVGGVILLVCGGILAFIVWGLASIDDPFDSDFPGSEDEPLTVTEGEAFEIRGFAYDDGWSISTTADGSVTITGVRATNDRADEDSSSAYPVFRLYRGNEQLATVDCTGGSSVAPGRSVTLECTAFDGRVAQFDEIEVYDRSTFE